MSVATSVAALVASQDDRDCQPGRARVRPVPSEKKIRRKCLNGFSRDDRPLRLSLSLAYFLSLAVSFDGVIIQQLTAVTEVQNRDLLL